MVPRRPLKKYGRNNIWIAKIRQLVKLETSVKVDQSHHLRSAVMQCLHHAYHNELGFLTWSGRGN